VADPAARAALRAIVDTLDVRNGFKGSGDNRVLTEADLRAMGMVRAGDLGLETAGGGSRPPIAPGGGSVGVPRPGQIRNLLNQLAARIMQSPLFIDLGRTIAAINIDLSFTRSNVNGIITGFGNRVTEVINSTSALVRWDNQQFVLGWGNAAAAHQWVITNATPFSALVTSVNVIQASVGNPTDPPGTSGSLYARLAQEAFVRANRDGELYGQYTVRIDTAGYVTGFGLAGRRDNNGVFSSEFYIRADQFAIASPSGSPAPSRWSDRVELDADGNVIYEPGTNNPRYELNGLQADSPNIPFIVRTESWTTSDGTIQPPGAYIRSAFIEYAAIDTANIRNAAVATLKIAGQAVSFPTGGENTLTHNLSNEYTPIWGISLHQNDASDVQFAYSGAAYFAAGSGGSENFVDLRVELDGSTVAHFRVGYPNNIHLMPVPFNGLLWIPSGWHSIQIQAREMGPDIVTHGEITKTAAFFLGLKR